MGLISRVSSRTYRDCYKKTLKKKIMSSIFKPSKVNRSNRTPKNSRPTSAIDQLKNSLSQRTEIPRPTTSISQKSNKSNNNNQAKNSLIIPPLRNSQNFSDIENITPQDSSRTNLSQISKFNNTMYLQIPDFDDEQDKSISQRTPKSYSTKRSSENQASAIKTMQFPISANGDNQQTSTIDSVIEQHEKFNQK